MYIVASVCTVVGWSSEVPCTYLCCIVEVSKLCLPAHQCIRVAHGEAKIKPKHSKLTQRAIAHSVAGLTRGHMRQGAAA